MPTDEDIPELPEHGPASGATIDRRLDAADRDLAEIRGTLAKVRESMQASRDGDHERAAELLDELEADG